MGAALIAGRFVSHGSPLETVALTASGAIVFIAAARVLGLFGAEEIELIRRSRIPGRSWMLAWLS